MGLSWQQETLEGGWSLLIGENRAMKSQVGKKDENEKYKPIRSLLRATG